MYMCIYVLWNTVRPMTRLPSTVLWIPHRSNLSNLYLLRTRTGLVIACCLFKYPSKSAYFMWPYSRNEIKYLKSLWLFNAECSRVCNRTERTDHVFESMAVARKRFQIRINNYLYSNSDSLPESPLFYLFLYWHVQINTRLCLFVFVYMLYI